jgi:hypothetical protein
MIPGLFGYLTRANDVSRAEALPWMCVRRLSESLPSVGL